MKYMLYFIKNCTSVDFDVVNRALLGDLAEFDYASLKFGIGNGVLNFYIFNYQ